MESFSEGLRNNFAQLVRKMFALNLFAISCSSRYPLLSGHTSFGRSFGPW